MPLLVHECVIVKWQPGFCIWLKGGPVGGLKTCLLLKHTDVLAYCGPVGLFRDPAGPFHASRTPKEEVRKGAPL